MAKFYELNSLGIVFVMDNNNDDNTGLKLDGGRKADLMHHSIIEIWYKRAAWRFSKEFLLNARVSMTI